MDPEQYDEPQPLEGDVACDITASVTFALRAEDNLHSVQEISAWLELQLSKRTGWDVDVNEIDLFDIPEEWRE